MPRTVDRLFGGNRPMGSLVTDRVVYETEWLVEQRDQQSRKVTVRFDDAVKEGNHGALVIRAVDGSYTSSANNMLPLWVDASCVIAQHHVWITDVEWRCT